MGVVVVLTELQYMVIMTGWRVWETGTVRDGGSAIQARCREIHGRLYRGEEETTCSHDCRRKL